MLQAVEQKTLVLPEVPRKGVKRSAEDMDLTVSDYSREPDAKVSLNLPVSLV